MLIMGANPASERPEWSANLDQLDFLVVQELFLTETAQLADVVFPALSWAESDGTFTNLERRVQRAPKALRNQESKAAADWMILAHVANRMGANWNHTSDRVIFSELTQAVPVYAGLSWEAIGDQGVQWDASSVRPEPVYLTAEQATIGGDGLALVSGTVLFDGGNLFHQTTHMRDMAFGAVVGMNPSDAANLGVAEGALVKARSSHGELTLAVKLQAQVQAGTVWIPESLPGAPVGALLNGSDVEYVKIER